MAFDVASAYKNEFREELRGYENSREMLRWLTIGELVHGLDHRLLRGVAKKYLRLNLPVPKHYHFPEFLAI